MTDPNQDLLDAAREMLTLRNLQSVALKSNDAELLGVYTRREPKAWKKLKAAVDALTESNKPL